MNCTCWLAPVLQQSGLRRTLSLVAEPLGEVKAQASAERQARRAEGSAGQRQKLGRRTTARLRKEAQAALDQDEAQADVTARHLAQLLDHLAILRAGREPWLSRRAPAYIKYASPYDQLARVKEWSAAPDLGDAGDEA